MKRVAFCLATLFALHTPTADADSVPLIATFSVREEPVDQVLLAFAEQTGISIVTDSSVSGTVSVVLHQTDPVEAILHLAGAADLLVEDRGGVYWMSRVMVRPAGDGLWRLHSTGASMEAVIREISRRGRRPVIMDGNLTAPIHLNTGPLTQREMLVKVSSAGAATLEELDDAFLVTTEAERETDRGATPPTPPVLPEPEVRIRPGRDHTGDLSSYTLEARRTTVSAVLDTLFEMRQDHYIPVAPLTAPVTSLRVSAPDTDELWERVQTALNLHVLPQRDTWIVAPAGQEQRLRPFQARAVITVTGRPAGPVGEILGRLPHVEVQAVDHDRNILVIRALPDHLHDALELAALLEREPGGMRTLAISLAWSDPEEIAAALRERFPGATFIPHQRRDELTVRTPEDHVASIEEAIVSLDQPRYRHLYRTAFLKPEELIAAVGTDHALEKLLPGGDGRSILLQGTHRRVRETREILEYLDQAKVQLRFDLCIIQHQNSTSRHRGTQARVARDESTIGVHETTWSSYARFDQLLALQFDLLSALGYQAALAVSGELAENAARLVVDTSLRGRHGDTVSLENASTYRYRDYLEQDHPQSSHGITREIDSGLEVRLEGRYHGDNSVTVNVRVSLSKQGADLTNRGNPPPTSRKVVETTVRVTAGEPIIIGGLLQQEESESSRRVPVLGQIPLLRRLVENHSSTREETEMVLYLSVFPERPESETNRRTSQTEALKELLALHSTGVTHGN